MLATLSCARDVVLRIAGLACTLGLVASSLQGQGGGSPMPRRLAYLHHAKWGETDGLPTSGANAVRRSPDGYLWLGDQGSLIRFDGVRFVSVDSSDSPALKSKTPGAFVPLLVDRSGTLWIARPDGALVTYRDGAFFKSVPASLGRGRATSISEDGLGRLWVNCTRPYLLVQGRLEEPLLPPDVPAASIQGFAADTGLGMFVGIRSGEIWHLSGKGATKVPLPYDGNGGVRPLLQSSDGTLWALNRGVEFFRDGRWTQLTIPGRETSGVNATRAVEMLDGSVVIATRGHGLVRWKHGIVDQFSESEGLSDAIVRGVAVDHEGMLWAATDAGVDGFRAAPFITLGRRQDAVVESPSQVIRDLDGSIWFTAYGHSTLYRAYGGLLDRQEGPIRMDSLRQPRGGRYFAAASASMSGVWVQDGDGKLLRYKDGTLNRLRATGLPAGRIPFSLHDDRSGATWLSFNGEGGGFGVIRNGRYRPIHVAGQTPASWASHISEDSIGDIWVAMQRPNVLLRIRGDSVITRFDRPTDPPLAVSRTEVERGDTLWSISGGSLVRLIGEQVAMVRVPAISQLLQGDSQTLLVGGAHLWVASNVGLCRIPLRALHRYADAVDTISPEPEWFTSLDGLEAAKLTSRVNEPAARGRDGRLWFSTPSGLAVVDPNEVPLPRAPLRVHIEELTVGGVPLERSSEVLVPENPERIEIRFTATELAVPERVRLQYRLDGADGDWVDAGAVRSATYTQLRPGTYVFHVRGSIGDAEAVEETLSLRVRSAWYEAWWFAAFVTLSFFMLSWLGLRAVFVARARRAADLMQARFDAELSERTRLARDLHDTLLQGFTGITLQLQAVDQTIVAAPARAKESLAKILTLADASLREARMMVWDMRAPELERQTLPEAIDAAARSVLADTGIEFDMRVIGNPCRLSPAIETTVLRIAREAVANVVRHAAASHVGLEITYSESQLVVTVRDDGRGMTAEVIENRIPSGHWGIRGMHERAERVGGTLTFRGAAGAGTSVTLRIQMPST